jgi:putative NADH-flavin reductase
MKIVIFGATGRSGLQVVEQALAAGHEVVGFVRDRAKMPVQHEHLTLVQGDVMNAADVDKAISADVDGVVSTLGATNSSPEDMLPVAVNHIIQAMRRHGIARFIFMTGAGVEMPQDKPKLMNHLIKFALVTLAGKVHKQSEEAARAVEKSGLAWVIVRVPRLNDEAHSENYRVGWVGVNTGTQLSRADAADFILKQLTSDDYLHKAPMISN